MENKGIDKRRISLGILLLLVSYFLLSIILKLCGLDLFAITNSEDAIKLNSFIQQKDWLVVLAHTIIFVINMFFVYSVTAKRYDTKRMLIISLMTFTPLFCLNYLFAFYQWNTGIMTAIVPLIISLFLVKERNWKNYLWAILRYIIFSAIIIVFQFGIMYLKVNLLGCDYHSDNIFNVVLLNLDLLFVYFAIYFFCKYRKERKKEGDC